MTVVNQQERAGVRIIVATVGLALLSLTSVRSASAAPSVPAAVDPRVARLVREVDPARIRETIQRLVGFGTRHTLSSTTDPARGFGAAERWVAGRLRAAADASGGRLKVVEDTFTVPAGERITAPAVLTNVVATLPGSDPGRVLIVSGHLDSRVTDVMNATSDAPGADDDGSGVATVLELARVMAPHRFRDTIVLLIVTGEEQGLYGSTHEARAVKDGNLGVEAMFTNDIVGSSHGINGVHDDRHVRVFSEGVAASESPAQANRRLLTGSDNDSPSRNLARAIASSQRRYLPHFKVTLINRRDRYLRGGDHIPFNELGYAAVRFTEMNEDWRHQHQDVRVENGVQYGDLPQFVDYSYTAHVAQVNLAALADIAWAPPPPARARILAARLESTSTLRWDRPVDADRAGYEVLWRSTTAADWQGSRWLGDTDEVTLPLSKDDFIFAVRSVSRAGNRSIPSLPTPALR